MRGARDGECPGRCALGAACGPEAGQRPGERARWPGAQGAIIGPIETKSGWHILKVEQRLPSEVPAFESVKDKLRKDVSDETFQRDLKAYLERLRKDAYIQINDQNIPTT